MKRLKVGDLVKVIAGKEKGKEGRVTKLIVDEDHGQSIAERAGCRILLT